MSDLREAAQRVVFVHRLGKSKVRSKVRSKVIDDLEAALELSDRPELSDSPDELHRLRAAVERSIRERDLSYAAAELGRQQRFPPSRAVIEAVIRELEWDSPLRWATLIERLLDVLTPSDGTSEQP